jgi:hypothetical protein
MNDDKKLNQPTDNTNSDDYQKILDEAAASIKPEDTIEPEPTAELKEIDPDTKPEEPEKLKDINSLQLEADIPSTKAELTDEPTTDFQSSEPIIPEENLTTAEPTKTETEPTQNPEEIKAQIDKILADDSSNTGSSTEIPKKTSNFKNIFIVSLIIFFVIAGAWIYFLFFYQPVTKQNPTATLPTPTEIISQEVCELNGTTYKVGESFKSADGCNTCSCEAVGTIACTEMACTSTPTVSTSSAVSSTKTEFQKMITNYSLYKDMTSAERTSFSSVNWMGNIQSTDTLYLFVQKTLKGSIKKLTINHSNLSSILELKNDPGYDFYLTPNYENWTNKEFTNLVYPSTGLGDLSPIYAYPDKLIWDTVTSTGCGGAAADIGTIEQKAQDQCKSLVKEIQTAFP